MKPHPQNKLGRVSSRSAQRGWQQMNGKQRREMTRKIQAEDISLEVVHPDAAGIDIGNETHYAAVPPARDKQAVQRFACTTAELKDMASWLKHCGIRTVAMQSTGVYWIPVYDILEEAGFEVYLVNARTRRTARAQERCTGEPMADEAAPLRPVAELISAAAGNPHDAELLAAAE